MSAVHCCPLWALLPSTAILSPRSRCRTYTSYVVNRELHSYLFKLASFNIVYCIILNTCSKDYFVEIQFTVKEPLDSFSLMSETQFRVLIFGKYLFSGI